LADRALRADAVDRADRAGTADRAGLADRATEAVTAARAGVAGALEQLDTNVEPVSVPEGGSAAVTVTCDSGLVPAGGGFLQTGDPADIPMISSSGPLLDGWLVLVFDVGADTGAPIPGEAYAVCLDADQT
jgi:hypothetical protein